MKSRWFGLCLVIAFCVGCAVQGSPTSVSDTSLASGSGAFATPATYDLPDLSNRYIVTFKPSVDDAGKRATVARVGGAVKRSFHLIPAAAVELPTRESADELRKVADVVRVEPDGFAFATTPNLKFPIPTLPSPLGEMIPWGLWRIRAPLAWEMTRGEGVRVAVLDTGGFNPDHADFPSNYGGCVSFVTYEEGGETAPCLDGHGHSTHVTGTIAASENFLGVVGIAPEAEIWNVKVLADFGWGLWSWVVAGLEWAADNDVNVVNLSLGGGLDEQALHDACDAATAAGVIIVAAAGNSGDWGDDANSMIYPARYDSAIAVGAIAADGSVASFSSVGEEMDVAAPGVEVLSTVPSGLSDDWSGTSMATPHVVGTVALMLAANPALTRDCVYEILRLTSSSPSSDYDLWNRHTGHGVVQAAAAVALAANPTVFSTLCRGTD